MSTSAEPNPKRSELSSQYSQTQSTANEPTVQEIRSWDEKKLLHWVKQKLSVPFKVENEQKILSAEINGSVFLEGAGDRGFFQSAGLSFGASVELANLAEEIIGRKSENEQAGLAGLTVDEALIREGITHRRLSALTREERIRVLRHIGIEAPLEDGYGGLLSVIDNLSAAWTNKVSILHHPDITSKFPVINQQALFARKCYHDLYKIITEIPIGGTKPTRVLLTGTPGIGKSTFLIYYIIRYLYDSTISLNTSENPARDILIFQPATSKKYYAFASPNIVRKGTYSDFERFLLLPTTWILVDWKPKSDIICDRATALFALSPSSMRDKDFEEFEKILDMRLCMPVWTYAELEECRSHVFPELSNKSLQYIHDRVGGVPRSCLEAPTAALRLGFSEKEVHETGLQRLEDAFREVHDPLNVLRAQAESLGSVKFSGRLLHKASAYVADRFAGVINTHSASNMRRKVMEGLTGNERDGTLGQVFECYVRHLFFEGGGARLRKRRLYKDLDKGKEPEHQQWFTIPQGIEHKPFTGMVDFSIPEEDTGTIWTPGPNFPCVDVIITPNSLFQVTISPHHPIKQEPLRKILEKLPAKEKISLYFVVPEENFNTFTFQNYHNAQGEASQKVPESVEMLEQWVLGVPLTGSLGEGKAEQSQDWGMKKRAAKEDDMQQPRTAKKGRTGKKVSNSERGRTGRKEIVAV